MTIKDIQIYHGMPFAEYADIDAMNISTLIIAHERSWEAMRHAMRNPTCGDTKATAIGSAFHTLTLQPDRESADIVVYDGKRGSSKAFEGFEADHPRQTVVTADELDQARLMARSVLDNPDCEYMLVGGNAEVVITWMDDTIPCKARIDYLQSCASDILDLKSTREIARFGNEAAKRNYIVKLGWYARAIKAHTGPTPDVNIIAVANSEPYESRRFQVPAEMIEWGSNIADDLIERYKMIVDTGEWPRLEPELLRLPVWYGYDEMEEFNG